MLDLKWILDQSAYDAALDLRMRWRGLDDRFRHRGQPSTSPHPTIPASVVILDASASWELSVRASSTNGILRTRGLYLVIFMETLGSWHLALLSTIIHQWIVPATLPRAPPKNRARRKGSVMPFGAEQLAECPLWDTRRQRLLYLDLDEPTLIEWDFATKTECRHRLALPAPLGGLCLGKWIACRALSSRARQPRGESMRHTDVLVEPDVSFARAPPNDASVHPSGILFVSTADGAEEGPTGGVFLISPERSFRRLAKGYTVGNGPAFSPDGRTVYVADSPKGVILAYDWNRERLALENCRVFASSPLASGLPDGITVDAEGGVWSARWGGDAVIRYTPEGVECQNVAVPAHRVTSCAFGGPSLETLYITTAHDERAPDTDLGGHLFSADVGVRGLLPALATI